MNEYHKIQTVYKRDPKTNHRTLLIGEYSLPEFEYLKDVFWIFTEKVDGTNISISVTNGKLQIQGRTDNAQIPTFLYNKITGLLTSEELLAVFDDSVDFCLYGEGYGAKIRKGGGNYKSDGVSFVLFDVKVGDWWLKENDVKDVAKNLGIDCVPIIGRGTLDDMVRLVQYGQLKSGWGDFKAEGIVARPTVELFTRRGDRIITKIKTKDFPR